MPPPSLGCKGGQLATLGATAIGKGLCVVLCVVTLPSLPGSSHVGRCRSGTHAGLGRGVSPA